MNMSEEIPNGMRINAEVTEIADGLIASEAYFQFPGTSVVVCLLTTHYGHFEVGSSFFPDPAEFDAQLARSGSRADAMSRIQPIANWLWREKQFLAGATLEPAVPAPADQEVGIGYSITRVPIVDNRIPPFGENRPLKDMTVSELRVAYTEATEALHAYTKMVVEKPAIQWLDTGSRLGPVPLKEEGKRATEDPLEDQLHIAGLQACVDSIALEIKRRHESFFGTPPGIVARDVLKQAPRTKPGGIAFVEEGPDLDAVKAAMDDLTVDDITDVITRMHAAVVADRKAKEAAMRKYEELGQEADAQLAAEIEQTKAQTEGAGAEQITEQARELFAAGLITHDEMARITAGTLDLNEETLVQALVDVRRYRERDSQVSGDGVEKAEGSE
jgi:hypothetical protein